MSNNIKTPPKNRGKAVYPPKNILLLGIVSFLNDISSEMIMPIIPGYLTQVLGIDKLLSGLIMGLVDGLSSLLKVFFGYLSDKLSNRKFFVFLGYLVSTVSKAGLALTNFWWDFLLLRISDRIGKGIRTAPRDALIAKSTVNYKTGRAFGFHRMMDTVGAILGPLMAIGLIESFKKYPSVEGYKYIFLISAIPGLLALILIFFFIKDKKETVSKKLTNISTLKDTQLILFLTVVGISALGRYSYAFTLWKSQSMGYTTAQNIGFYALFNIIYAISSYPFGILSDIIGKKRIITIGFAIATIASLTFSYARGFKGLIAAFVLYGLYIAIEDTIPRAYLADMAQKFEKATIIGSYHTVFGVFVLPASIISGWLWQHYNIDWVFLYASSMSFIAMILMNFVKNSPKARQNSPKILKQALDI